MDVKLKNLEIDIEKYPLADSPNLIDSFLILGYDEIFYQKKLLPMLSQEIMNFEKDLADPNNSKNRQKIRSYKLRNIPTILGIINSDYSGGMIDTNKLIEKAFPIPPSVLVGTMDSTYTGTSNIVLTNIQNKDVNIGYGYMFYETKIHNNQFKIYIPKTFVIVSQYPFFPQFNKLCIEIKNLFATDKNQIPIEIQIYNIVNFVPAPVRSNMNITFISKDELYVLNRIKSNEEFYKLKNQERYFFKQLNCYRYLDLNLNHIFFITSVENLIETYLYLLMND